MKLWVSRGWAILAHQLGRLYTVRSGNIVDLRPLAEYPHALHNRAKTNRAICELSQSVIFKIAIKVNGYGYN